MALLTEHTHRSTGDVLHQLVSVCFFVALRLNEKRLTTRRPRHQSTELHPRFHPRADQP